MKIALVINDLYVGGAQYLVCNLADGLVKQGHDVYLYYLTGSTLVRPDEEGVKLMSLCIVKSSVYSIIKGYFRLRSEFKKLKPDVVHSHLYHSNILTRLVRLTLPIPRLVSTAHNFHEGWLRIWSYRLTDYLSDVMTNVSDKAVEDYIRRKAVPANKIKAIYNGIDTTRFKFDMSDRIVLRNDLGISKRYLLLSVGRFAEQKDYPNLLEAIHQLTKIRQDFMHLIVGDGELRSEIEKQVSRLNISSYVTLLGFRNDIPELLSASDIFVLSSSHEGFGLVVAEAMACERIVVATDCGGVKEILDGYGYLISTKDPIALCNAINKAIDMTSNEKLRMGENARVRVVSKFSNSKTLKEYLMIYKNSI
jgi:glycosyltransferase involved in cell wall biosynthesis